MRPANVAVGVSRVENVRAVDAQEPVDLCRQCNIKN